MPLRRCLDSLAALRYRSFDVVVVDNAPRSGETGAVVRDWERAHPSIGVRYLQEPVPGAARAHNRALAVAEGSWVVRTDDDVVVDPEWLAAIAEAATSGPGVECVTGLILPAEIATPAQELLEQFGGYARGYRRRRVDLGEHRPADPLFPFTTGRLGSGANIAFDAAKLRARGGFDAALGPGTPARGGEDLLAVFDVLDRRRWRRLRAERARVALEPARSREPPEAHARLRRRPGGLPHRRGHAAAPAGARQVPARGGGRAARRRAVLTQEQGQAARLPEGPGAPRAARHGGGPRRLPRGAAGAAGAGPPRSRRPSAAPRWCRDRSPRTGRSRSCSTTPSPTSRRSSSRPTRSARPRSAGTSTPWPPPAPPRSRSPTSSRPAPRGTLPAAARARHVRRRLPRHAHGRRARARRAGDGGHHLRHHRRRRRREPRRRPDADAGRRSTSWPPRATRSARTAAPIPSSTRCRCARCAARSRAARPSCRTAPASRSRASPTRTATPTPGCAGSSARPGSRRRAASRTR